MTHSVLTKRLHKDTHIMLASLTNNPFMLNAGITPSFPITSGN